MQARGQRFYKYRDFSSFDRIVDIFENQRLYCATRRELNDPVEGIFQAEVMESKYSVVVDAPDAKRICSMSATIESVVQWSHYANGHNGIAIDFEPTATLEKVIYNDELVDIGAVEDGPSEPLLYKSKDWSYEEEYRHVSTSRWLFGRVCGVVIGARVSEPMKKFCGGTVSQSTLTRMKHM
jgi:hypothetical protein